MSPPLLHTRQQAMGNSAQRSVVGTTIQKIIRDTSFVLASFSFVTRLCLVRDEAALNPFREPLERDPDTAEPY